MTKFFLKLSVLSFIFRFIHVIIRSLLLFWKGGGELDCLRANIGKQ